MENWENSRRSNVNCQDFPVESIYSYRNVYIFQHMRVENYFPAIFKDFRENIKKNIIKNIVILIFKNLLKFRK